MMNQGKEALMKERFLGAGSVIEVSFQDWYPPENKRNSITNKNNFGFSDISYYDVKTELIIHSSCLNYK